MSEARCPLCLSEQITIKLIKSTSEKYWECFCCGLIFLDKAFHLMPAAEKAHYMNHKNDVADPRYQYFVAPVIDYILKNISVGSKGLDYGAGPGPVITSLLGEKGYEINLFDPYFCHDLLTLTMKYDFIFTCEVVEHFYSPAGEFQKLKELMKSDGHLVIMTDLYNDKIDFKQWYYHLDPTHVAFYRMKTFEWIKKHYQFKELINPHGRVVVFRN